MGNGRTELWRRCRAVVDRLVLPDPFDAESFIGMLARERGRPIELIPLPFRPDRPCGLLVSTHRADVIIYSSDTTAMHRQHILLHEAAHLVRGHDGGPGSATGSGVLLPHLSPALIRSVLGRTVYNEPQEREAELIASLIHHRVARHRSAGARARAARPRAAAPAGPREL
ncbi:MAG: hypothetical protein HOW97_11715 [Catenulispora sp.]|nr:hypothetical protein [Catenulispora sp.]